MKPSDLPYFRRPVLARKNLLETYLYNLQQLDLSIQEMQRTVSAYCNINHNVHNELYLT